jgi:RNase adaptor protein for sRNA GlmZ degradation
VQQFLPRTNNEIVTSLKGSYEALSHRDELIRNETGEGLEEKTGGASEDGDISFIVTVCCEEGRHRSVAFVGETSSKAYTANNRG